MHRRFHYLAMSAVVAFVFGCDEPTVRTKMPTAEGHLTHGRGTKPLSERIEDRGPDLDSAGRPASTIATSPSGGLLDFAAPDLFSSGGTHGGAKSPAGMDAASLDVRLVDVQTIDTNYRAAFQRGEEFLKNGRLDQALASFDEAKRVDPKNYLAYLGEALCYFNKNELGRASAAIDYAILYASDKSLLYAYRGQIRERQGNYHGAIADITVALKDHPQDVAALSMRAQYHSKVGNHAGAIADYTAALNVRPGELAWVFNRAVSCFHVERFKDAVADATAILAREPKLPDALFLRAAARFRLGETEAARADFDEAVRNGLNPRTAEQWRSAFHPPAPISGTK